MNRLFASLAAAAAVGLISRASAALDGTVLTVGAGETVAYDVSDASQASELASLTSIVFEDSAGVVALSGAAAATLNANVTGGGKVTATGLASLTLAGDCRGFTGGWDISNSPLVVTSRYGLGDSGTVGGTVSGGVGFGAYIHDSAATHPVTFRGSGLTNDVSVYLENLTANKAKLNFDEPGTWVQNGRIKINNSSTYPYLSFNDVVFNGVFHLAKQGYVYNKRGGSLVFNAASTFPSVWWYNDYTGGINGEPLIDLHFNKTGNSMVEENFYKCNRVHCGDEDVFPQSGATARICLEASAYMDLHGHNQSLTMLARKAASVTDSDTETVQLYFY